MTSSTILGTFMVIGAWQFLIILVSIFFLVMPLCALVSILKNDFKDNDKIIWVLIVLFLPFLGTLLYFILGNPKRINK